MRCLDLPLGGDVRSELHQWKRVGEEELTELLHVTTLGLRSLSPFFLLSFHFACNLGASVFLAGKQREQCGGEEQSEACCLARAEWGAVCCDSQVKKTRAGASGYKTHTCDEEMWETTKEGRKRARHEMIERGRTQDEWTGRRVSSSQSQIFCLCDFLFFVNHYYVEAAFLIRGSFHTFHTSVKVKVKVSILGEFHC